MFVQVIQGAVANPAEFTQQSRTWQDRLRPGAIGYEGSTVGVTDDGTAFILARFANQELAQANSQRPEQGAWWAETEQQFSGEVTFADTSDVTLMGPGGSDSAGFVQIMKGQVKDQARYAEFMERSAPMMQELRPDVIGGLVAWVGDGRYVQAVYFTSEEEARASEARMASGEMPPEFAEAMSLELGAVEYFDLRNPILNSA